MRIFNFNVNLNFNKNNFISLQTKTIAIANFIKSSIFFIFDKVYMSLSGRVKCLNDSKLNARNEVKEEFNPPRIESIIEYTADLDSLKIKEIKLEKNEKEDQIKIIINRHDDFNISIRCQDIFKSNAEVLVNAANTHLGGGSGIDGAIHRKGGNSYEAAHAKLRKHYNCRYKEGYASFITSGDLISKNIKNIIVVAGPREKEKFSELYSCYYNSLMLASQQQKISIAFPSISTGIFGFPLDKAAQISLKAIYDFVVNNPDSQLKTISIHFLEKQETRLKSYTDIFLEKATSS